MPNTKFKLKWLIYHAKPFLPSLFIIIASGAVCSLSGIVLSLLSKQMIDSATSQQFFRIAQYVLLIPFLILIDVGARAITSVISAGSSTKMSNSIQSKLFSHLAKSGWLEFSRYHSGDVLTRMTSDVEVITNLLISSLPHIISLSITIAGALIALLIFDPLLAIPTLLLGPVSILLSRVYGRKLKSLHIRIQEAETGCRSFLLESLQNMPVLKAFCLEGKSIDRINNLQNNKLNIVLQRSRVSAASNSSLLLGSWLGYFLVFGWGALNLSKGIATFGTFTAMLQLVGYVQGPFSGLTHIFPQVVSAWASADRLIELEKLKPDTHNFVIPDIQTAGIQFDHVSYGYDKRTTVLEDVSTIIYPGETAALIGSSGEGKTTIIRLLLSLIPLEIGDVYIFNNQQKFKVSAASRCLVSYVPQGNTLFSGSIADNLRIGNAEATDKELEAAARSACAWEFISELQNGLHTIIGEHGHGLSEGQAQRLAIARALLRKSPIMILDEATSALDINTELKVLQAIRSLIPARTCIIITHRITALQICHRILKLEDGHLFELIEQPSEASTTEAS